ncbi:hypothetical protein C8A05DRAFT_17419 [Staphylotrichum tortipilum]|uniref:Uncharacterized protein n=1 Tax=Staphylotrichum tortipilum TaxID=2831512 RepID=A0AAN6MHE2_9PEZI|nr:hypothetical protein C8A05DRAFT_17419 [Staphylotrichum longicolle]
MDDTARLVSELHGKLADLDGKVAAYQRDLLAQFHRHMDECLKKYPDHVSTEVARVIAESVSSGRYPALSPPPPNAWNGRKSPPPVLPHTSGTPKEAAPRSPHAREKEFQGLFTPTYLPLLENNDRAYRSPPMSPPPTAVNGPFLALSTDNVVRVEGAEEDKAAAAAAAKEPVSVLRHERSPDPPRRLTDWSTSSAESSSSDSKVRRSALRRSSSSTTKGSSPRRVRFEFEGEEVFPTASSPQAAATISIALALEAEAETEAEPPVMVDESVAYTTTSLLDVEGEEDFLPRPKKVSSTQALQALTRMPLDEGTVWTRVNPNLEGPSKMNGDKHADEAAADLASLADSQTTVRALPIRPASNGRFSTHVEQQQPARDDDEDEDDDDDDDASDEECLSMKPKSKTPSPAATTPFTRPPRNPTSSSQPNGTDATEEDADPFFDLDDVPSTTPSSHSKYLPATHDSDSDSDSAPTPSLRLRTLAAAEAASASDAAKIPPVSPSSVLFSHSIGSYMGRSMTVAPIKDAKLYDEIAGMKDVHFFVGSIDGRTGQEAGDLGSFRASSLMREGNLGGVVPRSFTERFALEEEMERRRRAGERG